MANFRNRMRVVYFRVSEEEFQQFADLCQRCGARNYVRLGRVALEIMRRRNESGFEREVTERLQQLENPVEQILQTMTGNTRGQV